MLKTFVLTSLRDTETLNALRNQGCCVLQLNLDDQLCRALDSLDDELDRKPPTSLAASKDAWLPLSEELARLLAVQAAGAGEFLDWQRFPDRFSHALVVSSRIIPIDLIPCRGSLLGIECIVSHASEGSEAASLLTEIMESARLPLRRIAHVCSYDPRPTTLHDMDVVAATLGLGSTMAIEHYFYPAQEVAAGLFQRSDVDILHFECHGTVHSLQVDNPHGTPIDVRGLFSSSGPSVYFFLGCNAGGDMDGTAPTFVRKGARASMGAYCGFLSGGDSGDVSESTFYDALYRGLIAGDSLGEAIRTARKAAAPGRIYYCTWLLFGNPNVTFKVQKFGGAKPSLPFRRRVDPASFP